MKQKSNSDAPIKKTSYRWVFKIVILTFALSITMSLIAESFLNTVSLPLAFIILLFFILIGIVFDTIGISIAAADITPFISMSSRKVQGANQAVFLLKRADLVTNICNDVVGDICGIISGAMGAIITLSILQKVAQLPQIVVAVIISAIIATTTVSGKAIGKIIAMKKAKEITLAVGRILRVFPLNMKKEKNG